MAQVLPYGMAPQQIQSVAATNAPQAVLGVPWDSGGFYTTWTVSLVTSGTFSTGTAQMQASLGDGAWYNIGSATAITTANIAITATATGAFRLVRLNLTVAVTGGGLISTIVFGAAEG